MKHMVLVPFAHRARAALLAGSVLAGGLALPAYAQSIPEDTPPVRSPQDENGVDLASGKIFVQSPGVSIGTPGEGGLSYTRSIVLGEWWKDGYTMYITSDGGNQVIVNLGDRSLSFTNSSGTYTSNQGDGSTLTGGGSSYMFKSSDGTIINFALLANGAGNMASSIVSPSGERLEIFYKEDSFCFDVPGVGTVCVPTWRIQSVTTNSGYQLKHTYQGNSASADLSAFLNLTSVKAINNSVEYCNPTADSCTVSPSWPSISMTTTYAGSDATYNFTDTLNNTTQIKLNNYSASDFRLVGIRRPGSSSDDVTVAYDANNRVSVDFR